MSIAGVWYNELGSEMTLQVAGKTLAGYYISKVGAGAGIPFELVGMVDAVDSTPSVAFCVVWQAAGIDAQAVTAWGGQLQVQSDGTDVIVTTWLLTMETISSENWKSTLVGKDMFTRTQPSVEVVDAARKQLAASHPLK